MFNGSHRTNKREINLAGASASSRSSRKANLNVARQQRLQRAQAKAKLNGAKCLQRCWRGCRGRRLIAIELDNEYQVLVQSLSQSVCDGVGSPTQQQQVADEISKAASLLAFRMSPALLPFFASRHIAANNDTSNTKSSSIKKKWGEDDKIAEQCMRKDILMLGNIIQQLYAKNQQSNVQLVSPIALRKILSITLILLRQSINNNNNKLEETEKLNGENQCLIQLLDHLLEKTDMKVLTNNDNCNSLVTNLPSDCYVNVLKKKKQDTTDTTDLNQPPSISGWMINLFLCLRDYSFSYNQKNDNGGGDSSMDIDDSSSNDGDVISLLLKWCCQIILHLAPMDVKHLRMQQAASLQERDLTKENQPLMYQQGLALLASILFASSNFNSVASVNEQLVSCLVKIEQSTRYPTMDKEKDSHDMPAFSLLTHYLATSMDALTTASPPNGNNNTNGKKVPGLMSSFFSSSSAPTTATAFMNALRETLSTREFIVLNQVLAHADSVSNQTKESQELVTCAIPMILQYTLQHQHDLAVLASFSAQGQNIASWFSSDGQTAGTASVAIAASAAAYDAEDIEGDESDDDDQDMAPIGQPQQQVTQRSTRDNSTTSTARYSRTDLQTLPKLDALYQNGLLRSKKVTVDRLRSVMSSHGKQVALLISLAEKVGKGEWIQRLGNVLFAPEISDEAKTAQDQSSLSPLLEPVYLSQWKNKAQGAYTTSLATIMTTCSGIQAGRNAVSPLLSKLAFNEAFVQSMWKRASYSARVITSQSILSMNPSTAVSYCDAFSSFCDTFSHQLLAVDDATFLERYHQSDESKLLVGQKDRMNAKDIVLALKSVLNDLYWVRPVLASDITSAQSDPESKLRLQRARILLSGTKLYTSLYERWCRLHRVVQFCSEDCWWFPQLATRGQHDSNPIIQSQVTTFGDQANDDMDDSSIESAHMDDDEASPMSANDAGGDALATAFRDPKMARVLTYIPFAMPFTRRVNLFNSLLEADKAQTQDETASFQQMMMNFQDGEEGEMSSRERVTIRRDALYSDSKQRLNSLGKRLRKKVQVTFVNKHGQQEAGIDGGGVFKEFLDDLITDGFLPETVKEESGDEDNDDDSVVETHPDFFSVTPLQTLKVNTDLDGNEAMLSNYEFLGRVLGKAIYESILVEPQFCLPFLNKLLGKQNSLDDLKNLDPEYYKNLKSLRHMSAQEIKDLGLTFELHDSATVTIELIPRGSSMPVTKENVIQYIHLVSHQKMNVRGSRQTSAFLHGFRDIIPAQWVRLFSAYELQKLISGDDGVKGIDVRGMMSVMRYSGGLHPSQPIVHWLWQVVAEMTPEQQRKFLKFMTSCSRQPLLGFASMVPAPCIQQTRLREDDQGRDIAEGMGTGNIRLPSSSTCMNLLKLPKYTSKEMLRDKLLYAIESAAGFELS